MNLIDIPSENLPKSVIITNIDSNSNIATSEKIISIFMELYHKYISMYSGQFQLNISYKNRNGCHILYDKFKSNNITNNKETTQEIISALNNTIKDIFNNLSDAFSRFKITKEAQTLL